MLQNMLKPKGQGLSPLCRNGKMHFLLQKDLLLRENFEKKVNGILSQGKVSHSLMGRIFTPEKEGSFRPVKSIFPI